MRGYAIGKFGCYGLVVVALAAAAEGCKGGDQLADLPGDKSGGVTAQQGSTAQAPPNASARPLPPTATAPINGQQLPPPQPKFNGKIERNAAQSKPSWTPRVVPPKGAPNILLIMTDDTGFGVTSTFGGVVPTPSLDRVAANGLRYTNFNSTALCSPSRAALITGRNHHSVGFGVVAEQATGFPGYDSVIPRDKATIGRS